MNKPNCYDCKWRKGIPGDAHSECIHPKIGEGDRILSPLLLMQGLIPPAMKRINASGDPHGIKMGWFSWPLNFDPTWLQSCDGFEKQENKQ